MSRCNQHFSPTIPLATTCYRPVRTLKKTALIGYSPVFRADASSSTATVIRATPMASLFLVSEMALLHDSTAARVGGAFPTSRSGHHSAGFRPTQLGHPVEDVTPDRNFSPLCLAVPRLQSASEHGLVSEEAVFQRVPAVGSPTPSATLVARPGESSQEPCHAAAHGPSVGPADTAEATRGNHNHDVLCTGRAELNRRLTCGRRLRLR